MELTNFMAAEATTSVSRANKSIPARVNPSPVRSLVLAQPQALNLAEVLGVSGHEMPSRRQCRGCH